MRYDLVFLTVALLPLAGPNFVAGEGSGEGPAASQSYDLLAKDPDRARAARAKLESDLQNGEFSVARSAVRFCVARGHLEHLTPALKHSRDDIKLFAAKGLASRRARATVAALIDCLEANSDAQEGSDEATMRTSLKVSLASVIGKLLGKAYTFRDPNDQSEVKRLVQSMRAEMKRTFPPTDVHQRE